MKECTRCNIEKPLTNFRKKSRAADGLQPWCRECFAEYERLRYQNGDNLRKKQNDKNRIDRNKEYVKKYLQTHPCSDCGDADWWALDFDHKEQSTKSNTISMMIAWNGLDRIKEEIAKCQVLCVKCHRKKTITQCGWWRTFD